jgi:hypothetical protein
LFFSTSIKAPTIVEMFPAYYIFNSLLLLLLVLHIVWTYLIMRIAYNSIVAGKVCKWFKMYEILVGKKENIPILTMLCMLNLKIMYCYILWLVLLIKLFIFVTVCISVASRQNSGKVLFIIPSCGGYQPFTAR